MLVSLGEVLKAKLKRLQISFKVVSSGKTSLSRRKLPYVFLSKPGKVCAKFEHDQSNGKIVKT